MTAQHHLPHPKHRDPAEHLDVRGSSPMSARLHAIRRVAVNPLLARVECSLVGFNLAESATWLAMLVWAFERGGAREAGIAATATLALAVVTSPFAAFAGDRFQPDRALWWGYGLQAIAMAGTALAMWAGSAVVSYLFAGVTFAVGTFTRPVIGALLPLIARRPTDLVGANVLVGMIENAGSGFGPLLAALLLFLSEPATVFAVSAAMTVAGAALTMRLRVTSSIVVSATAGSLWAEITGGLTAMQKDRSIRSIIIVVFIGGLAIGIIDVTLVNFAETQLQPGGASAGILAAAIGLGGVLGLLAVGQSINGTKLARYLVIASALMGLPLVAMATVDSLAPSLFLMAAAGAGVGVITVIGSVALQRRSPQQVLARVFGVTESFNMLAMAIGAAAGSFLLDVREFGDAALTLGSVITAMALLATALFVHHGADVEPPGTEIFDRLVADPLFAPLDVRALERLAAGAELMRRVAGSTLMRKGDVGDKYYLLVTGTLAVHRDVGDDVLLGPGMACGEVALLDDIPRTATVTCTTDVDVLAIGRDDFLEAVTGHPYSMERALQVTMSYRSQMVATEESRDPDLGVVDV
jgi:MFS family permease